LHGRTRVSARYLVGMSQAAKKAATAAAEAAAEEVRAMPVFLCDADTMRMRCASSTRMHHVAALHAFYGFAFIAFPGRACRAEPVWVLREPLSSPPRVLAVQVVRARSSCLLHVVLRRLFVARGLLRCLSVACCLCHVVCLLHVVCATLSVCCMVAAARFTHGRTRHEHTTIGCSDRFLHTCGLLGGGGRQEGQGGGGRQEGRGGSSQEYARTHIHTRARACS
jgi:hypothetical protein